MYSSDEQIYMNVGYHCAIEIFEYFVTVLKYWWGCEGGVGGGEEKVYLYILIIIFFLKFVSFHLFSMF